MTTSLRARHKTAAKPKSDANWKLPYPGWSIIITPKNPIRIADHLRHPTFSPNKMAAPKVTNNGVACKTDASKDIGIKTIAEVKERDPNKSAIVRNITCLLSNILSVRFTFKTTASANVINVPPKPSEKRI